MATRLRNIQSHIPLRTYTDHAVQSNTRITSIDMKNKRQLDAQKCADRAINGSASEL